MDFISIEEVLVARHAARAALGEHTARSSGIGVSSRTENRFLSQRGGPDPRGRSRRGSNASRRSSSSRPSSRPSSRQRGGPPGSFAAAAADPQLLAAYEEMKQRCAMLTERLIALERVASAVDGHRNSILEQSSMGEELQARLSSTAAMLEALDGVFVEGPSMAEEDAATLIQQVARGRQVRQRVGAMRAALLKWRARKLAPASRALSRWVQVQRQAEEAAFEMAVRTRGYRLAKLIAEWRAITLARLPDRLQYRQIELSIARSRRMHAMAGSFKPWCSVANGASSRRALVRTHERRRRMAELQLLNAGCLADCDCGECDGQGGEPPTAQQVENEVRRLAVAQIRTMRANRIASDVAEQWRACRLITLAQSHRIRWTRARCFRAWVADYKSAKHLGGTEFQKRKVEHMQLRFMLSNLQFAAFAAWRILAARYAESRRRGQMVQAMWVVKCFATMKGASEVKRATSKLILERLMAFAAEQQLVVFRAWATWAIENQMFEQNMARFKQSYRRRQEAMAVRQCMQAWRQLVWQARSANAPELAAGLESLQSANKEFEDEIERLLQSAERTSGKAEAAEQRASAAETKLSAATRELQALEAQLEKQRQQPAAAATQSLPAVGSVSAVGTAAPSAAGAMFTGEADEDAGTWDSFLQGLDKFQLPPI